MTDILDEQPKNNFYSVYPRYKYALTIFALLDAFYVLRSYQEITAYFKYGIEFSELAPLRTLIIVSFSASAFLIALRKKEAFILSYIQFPLRLIFMTFSFGFLINLFGGIYGTTNYWSIIVLVFGLEIIRIIQTIIIHRKLIKFH